MPTLIVISLNARLQPLDRGELEDALDATLKRRGHSAEVTGGGSYQDQTGEITGCEIEIEVLEVTQPLVDDLVRAIGAMLGARGSEILIPGRDAIPVGSWEGLALRLNGVDLPRDVYDECDADRVYAECNRLLDGCGKIYSFWNGPVETVLYAYGPEVWSKRDRLSPLLTSYPLCEKARLEQIA